MEFPSIDEPTTRAINAVITQCENARRLCLTASETSADETLRGQLADLAETYASVVADLRNGLFATAGEASGDGTVKGFFRRLREAVGQRTGWRDRADRLAAVAAQQKRALAAFDVALKRVTGERVADILRDKRSAVAALTPRIAALADGA